MPLTALHEVLEALLANLDMLARNRDWNEDAWISERHSVINRLIKVFKSIPR